MMVSLFRRLMTCSLVLVFLAALIMAAKSLLKRHLSPNAQFRLWLLFLLALSLPFLPFPIHGYADLLAWMGRLKPFTGEGAGKGLAFAGGREGIGGDWLEDFSVSVSRQAPSLVYEAMLAFWICGAAFLTVITILSCLKVRRLKLASLPLEDREIRILFEDCRRELQVKQDIPLLCTAALKAPVTVGSLRPCILIPGQALTESPRDELRYIFMHELLHCKRRDTLVNHLACLAQILYWFHPIVWFSIKQLRADEEAACDQAVLDRLEAKDYLSYGKALLRFAAGLSGISYTPTASIGGKAKELKTRILKIRDYRHETRRDKVKGAVVLFITAALICTAAPSITSRADSSGSYDFSDERVVEVDLSSYFRGYEGCFVLYDRNRELFSIYNRMASLKRVSPNSTYKPYSALTALQAGIITPDATMQNWDGTSCPFAVWEQDHTLTSAMNYSVNWYFDALDRQTGIDTLERSFAALSYGNADLTGGLGTYWAESTLKISPVEQVELLIRLEDGTLPFDLEYVDAVKESLLLAHLQDVSLYGKTGTGAIGGKEVNGWLTGFVESAQNTYLFAVHIEGEDGANGSAAGQIGCNILHDLGILPAGRPRSKGA